MTKFLAEMECPFWPKCEKGEVLWKNKQKTDMY